MDECTEKALRAVLVSIPWSIRCAEAVFLAEAYVERCGLHPGVMG